MDTMLSYVRTGDTSQFTSRSDSGIIENQIKVEGYLYVWDPYALLWRYETQCPDSKDNSSHAVCRTFWYGGSGWNLGQEGYHYFINYTYGNESLETWDSWFS